MVLRQCRYCGGFFNAPNPTMRYCSKDCKRRRKLDMTNRYRRLKKAQQGTFDSQLADTTIVTVNGQQRVKAAVVLEKLVKKGRVNGKK